METALQSLSQRSYSHQKLVEKLRKAGFAETEVAECLTRLEKWGYINDREFGVHRISSLLGRLKSRSYIEMDLVDQGLSPALTAELLESGYSGDLEVTIAKKLLQKRKNPKRETAARGYGILMRAGFSENTIRQCFPDVSST
jgi:SOS response regulatory protein OraA/RecX